MKRFLTNIILVLKTIENISTFVLDYLGLLHGHVIYKIKNKPYKFLVRANTSDKDEVVAVMSGHEYNFSLLPKIKNPIIFDVGSYIGDSAVYASDFFHNKCRIYSFEADFDNYRYTNINLILNNINTTTLFYLALGNKNGLAYIDKENRPFDGYRTTSKKIIGSSVQMNTITEIARKLKLKNIDILKMDIEGGEFEIFNDRISYDFISKQVSYIYLEYHYDFGQKRVEKLLQKLFKDFLILHHRDNLLLLKNKAN